MDVCGDSVLRRRPAARRAVPRARAARFSPLARLRFEMPSVLRNFPARFLHLRVFGASLIQHGVGVVDMYIDFTWTPQLRQPAETFENWHVAHLARGLAGALYADEFVVVPESSVEQKYVGGLEFGKQVVVDLGNGRHAGEALARRRFEDESERGLPGVEFRLALLRYVRREVRAERKRARGETRIFAGGSEQSKGFSGCEVSPCH